MQSIPEADFVPIRSGTISDIRVNHPLFTGAMRWRTTDADETCLQQEWKLPTGEYEWRDVQMVLAGPAKSREIVAPVPDSGSNLAVVVSG